MQLEQRRFWSVIVMLAAGCLAPLHAQPGKKPLALVGGMLLDGYEVPPLHHAAVIVEGNRIVAVGPASEVKIPAGATVIDTSGRTMLPGLIEAHAHLNILGHGDWRPVQWPCGLDISQNQHEPRVELGQDQADDAVIGLPGDRVQLREDPGLDPLVAAVADRGGAAAAVGDRGIGAAEPQDLDEFLEDDPVADPRLVAAQRVSRA